LAIALANLALMNLDIMNSFLMSLSEAANRLPLR
jgi:hypothetical protein